MNVKKAVLSIVLMKQPLFVVFSSSVNSVCQTQIEILVWRHDFMAEAEGSQLEMRWLGSSGLPLAKSVDRMV